MLTLDKVIGVKWGIGNRWEQITDTSIRVRDLFISYSKIQVSARDQDGRISYYLLSSHTDKYGYYDGTPTDLLTTQGLVMSTTGIVLSEKTTKFIGMSQLGYQIEIVNDANLSMVEANVPDFAPDNIRVTNGPFNATAVDIGVLASNAMFSISGYYHRPVQKPNSVFIKDVGKTYRKTGRYQNAIWDFSKLGGLTYCDIPVDTIELKGTMLQFGLHTDTKNKYPILSFMGYIITVDDVILTAIGPGAYSLDLSKISFLEKYKEARDYIDMTPVSSLLTQHPASDADLINITVVRAILQLSQSFWVVVNTPSGFVTTEPLTFLNSGLYVYSGLNRGPVVCGYGRHPSYSVNGGNNTYYVSIGGVTGIEDKPDRNAHMLIVGCDY